MTLITKLATFECTLISKYQQTHKTLQLYLDMFLKIGLGAQNSSFTEFAIHI